MERMVWRRNEKWAGCWSVVKVLLLVLLMAALPAAALCATVVLDWDPSTDADLAGYRVYYQANSAAQPFQGVGAAEGSAPVDVAASNSATINGLDPGASYYFAVTAYNSTGAESVYSNVVEIKESLPPAISITSPTGAASLAGTVSVVASASDNSGVGSVEFYLNGALQASDSTAPYVFDWNTSSLPSGQYTLSAKAIDINGNAAASELTVAVAGDTAPPAVSISGPGSNTAVSGSVIITATATDDTGVAKLELYDNDALVFAGNEGVANYSWDSVAAGNGSHIITARAFDAAGNAGSANVTLNVANDLSAPVVFIASPAAGSTVGATVQVSAGATDDIGVTLVEFYLDGVLQGTDTSAPYALAWNSASFANGTYTWTAKAFDASGKAGESAGASVTVFNDSTAPAVTITMPAGGATVDASVAVTLNASDDVAVTRMELYLGGALLATSDSSSFTFNWNTSALANGTYTLSAKAYDAAGNVGQAGNVTVTVQHPVIDATPPVIKFSSPTSTYVSSSSVRIAASATDNVAATRMEIYVDGVLRTASNSAAIYLSTKFSIGKHSITVKAYDAARNASTSSKTVTRYK